MSEQLAVFWNLLPAGSAREASSSLRMSRSCLYRDWLSTNSFLPAVRTIASLIRCNTVHIQLQAHVQLHTSSLGIGEVTVTMSAGGTALRPQEKLIFEDRIAGCLGKSPRKREKKENESAKAVVRRRQFINEGNSD